MSFRSSRLLVPLFVALAVFAWDASAQMQCAGPYYDSKAWNSSVSPHSGGCWLSGSVCYECWHVYSGETAGCEWGTADCKKTLVSEPAVQTVSLWIGEGEAAPRRLCLPLADGRGLDEAHLV